MVEILKCGIRRIINMHNQLSKASSMFNIRKYKRSGGKITGTRHENITVKAVTSGDIMLSSQPDARVVPTPLSPQSVVMAASRFGSFLKAFLDSV